ncbi:hypothetical protein XI08_38315 [Bradyrhizobium sp. CCBAU 11361]|nr:hypothetical protein [Bradyrhizobium sp. CCBAU 11361]
MAAQGYDSITIDVQHGALDYSSALPMLQAMRASGVVPMARVPWMEPGIIEAALSTALTEGRVIATGLDVFDEEPPAPHHPLLDSDQVVLTPHIAGLTQQAAERMAVSSIQSALDFFAGRLNSDLIVNRDFRHDQTEASHRSHR